MKKANKIVRSNIKNCQFVTKHADRKKGKTLFEFPSKPLSGAAYVNMDGYLICPVDMFTPRQLKSAMKKYHATA